MSDQPEGVFELCSLELGAYWRRGTWTRDKLRGAALVDDELRDQDVSPLEILRAPFRRGWLVETVEHDGEWCDPAWPTYRLETTEPAAGGEAASWLELA